MTFYVEFKEFQSAITPGQFVAIYQKNQLIASGVIFNFYYCFLKKHAIIHTITKKILICSLL